MTRPVPTSLLLPTRTALPPSMTDRLIEWLAEATAQPPTPAAAALWLGVMSADAVGKIAAAYALGWVWLGWRSARWEAAWQPIESVANTVMPSADFLEWQADIRLLRALPLYPAPRGRWQSPSELRREARVITYLRHGAPGQR